MEDYLQVLWVQPSSCCRCCYELKVALEISSCFLQDQYAVLLVPIVLRTISKCDDVELLDEESVNVCMCAHRVEFE